MSDVSALMTELHLLKARLASVQDKLASARLARRNVRDAISRECLRLNMTDKKMVDWRPMTPDEVARLDAVHASTAPVISEYLPQEAVLKEAVRHAEIDLERAKKAKVKPGDEPGKTGGKEHSPVHGSPKGTGDRGRSPRFPPETGGNRGFPGLDLGLPGLSAEWKR
jgi:hypothetical protein